MLYRKIDDAGLFLEDVITDTVPTLEDGTVDPHYIEIPCPSGFYHPKWTGAEWVEGGTPPEPVPEEPSEIEKLKLRLQATEDAMLFLMDGGM